MSNTTPTPSTATVPSEMRAWEYSSTTGGIHKNMHLNPAAKTPAVPPQAGNTIVRIHSVSLNHVDHVVPELPVVGRLVCKYPMTPGKDFSGIVASIGTADSSKHNLKVGDRVYGSITAPYQKGALAEYISVPISNISRIPSSIPLDLAASVPTCALATYQALVPHIQRNRGDKVFINGGSGGLGIFSIQFAKLLGCHVTTTCSTANVDFCKTVLGADEVIDYTKTPDISQALRDMGNGAGGPNFKLAIDNVGLPFNLYHISHLFLRPGDGVFVQVGGHVSLHALFNLISRFLLPRVLGGGSNKFAFLNMDAAVPEQLREISGWIEEGKVKCVIEEKFPFEQAVPAMERFRTGKARGKIVVRVGSGKDDDDDDW